ncbi:hypothetical protein PENTCL1PPCAC_29066 [Pristionchus entomophagus]|uniref:AMP-binding protein n=1 Tax=Pristionchus entomophagus TaxID=358040 RepID=A0AAV5UIV1_9BILA|nr:hypothetical protein PENTCL1PPCAC_29066 [Pristionchus entomophagus]
MAPQPVSQSRKLLDDWRKTLNNEIVESPFPPITVPNETLVSRILKTLRESALLHPEKAAVMESSDTSRCLTYQHVHDQALSVAAFLNSRGFGVGDRGTAFSFNCVQLPVIHLGVWAAGGIFDGSTAVFKHHETVFQMSDCASAVLFSSEALLGNVLRAVADCPSITRTIICIRSSSAALPDGVIDFNDVIATPPLDDVIPVPMDTPCFMSYSSGTTGLPKGVIHTHRSYHSSIEILRSHFLREVYPVLGVEKIDWHQDHQIVATTCYHMLGFGMLNWWLLTGSPIILMESLDEEIYPLIVEKYKPRYLSVTPPIFAFLTKHPRGISTCMDSVQLILSSGAPLSQEMGDELFKHHPSVKYIVQGYGMTETGYSHLPLLLKEGVNASSGVVAANYLQKMVLPGTFQPCKLGEWGEILVKGPGCTIGYRNNPELTNNFLFDKEGWLHTGDVGYMDDLGNIHIVDRMKEMIKVNWMHQNIQMPPAELEGILLSHHKIRDVAVVGVPHDDGGELVRAFVVKAEEDLSGAEVEKVIEDKLAPYKKITGGVYFIDKIPRSESGKILRRVLRENY